VQRPIVAVLLVLPLLVLAIAGPSVGAQEGGTIRVGLDVDAGTGDPRLARDTSAFRLGELVFDGLVALDTELVPQPALAERWENPDPTTWVFHLRQGATFHDGEAVTAEDVVYTYETILDEAFGAPNRALYVPITGVTARDPQTVEFKLTGAYAPFLSYMEMGIVPQHVASDPASDFANNPVGAGPFAFVRWQKNNQIELEAFAEYWQGAPKVAGVTLSIVPDNTVRATALETGDLDLIHSPLSPQDVERLQTTDGVEVSVQTALGYTYLNFNTADPLLADVNVRRAIAQMVDKAVISEEIYQGMDTPGQSPLVPNTWWYSEVADHPFDPAAAAELLATAGWTDSDGDGVLDKDGQKLSLLLKTHSEDPNRIQTIEYLQNVLGENGIEASVETAEFPTFFDALMNHDYQIALVGWLRLVDPDYAMFNQFRCEGTSNYGQYCNPRVDELLEQGRVTLEPEQRVGIYKEAAQIVIDEVAYDVLLYQGYIVATRDTVEGFQPHPAGSFNSLWGTSLS
jgi:peptide/nickel transport system substrate-binding protein